MNGISSESNYSSLDLDITHLDFTLISIFKIMESFQKSYSDFFDILRNTKTINPRNTKGRCSKRLPRGSQAQAKALKAACIRSHLDLASSKYMTQSMRYVKFINISIYPSAICYKPKRIQITSTYMYEKQNYASRLHCSCALC